MFVASDAGGHHAIDNMDWMINYITSKATVRAYSRRDHVQHSIKITGKWTTQVMDLDCQLKTFATSNA
jgi:hypothetical protein